MEKKAKKVDHVGALNNVIRILEPLGPEDRKRVIGAASTFLLGNSFSIGNEDKEEKNVISKLGQIIQQNGTLKPGHKAAVVAYCYMKQNKLEQFRLDDIRNVYDEIGLTCPDRLDMTMRAAVSDGKKLFKSVGHNAYGLTYHGQELGKKYST